MQSFIGSVGNSLFSGATQGGGTVILNMKTLEVFGKISANGYPINPSQVGENKANGGSGGYILLNFTSISNDTLTFGGNGSVQSIGGSGINEGASGSGGRIVM